MQRFIRLAELTSAPRRGAKPERRGRYPFSEATLYRKIRTGLFPQPITLAGVVCWPLDVLEAWEAAQRQQPHLPRPHVLAAAASSLRARAAASQGAGS
jgi:hypothetical protein